MTEPVGAGTDVVLRALAQNVLVVRALVKMLREEFGDSMSLSEIVDTWGTKDELAAVKAWEAR